MHCKIAKEYLIIKNQREKLLFDSLLEITIQWYFAKINEKKIFD